MFKYFIVNILLKKYVNMFEHTEIAEYIYEGVVENYYIKTTRADANRAGHIRKIIGESASPNTYSKMSESAVKRRKRYVDHPKNRPKPTCLIHVPMHSSDE